LGPRYQGLYSTSCTGEGRPFRYILQGRGLTQPDQGSPGTGVQWYRPTSGLSLQPRCVSPTPFGVGLTSSCASSSSVVPRVNTGASATGEVPVRVLTWKLVQYPRTLTSALPTLLQGLGFKSLSVLPARILEQDGSNLLMIVILLQNSNV
jgi:hypothetical protein